MKRRLIVAGVVAGLLALTGCASAADTDALADSIAGQGGVNGADVEVQHPGAPWNTETVVWVYVDDTSVTGVADAVRGVATVVAADGAASGSPLTVFAVDGAPDDFGSRAERNAAVLRTMKDVSAELGVNPAGAQTVRLENEDIQRLAGR